VNLDDYFKRRGCQIVGFALVTNTARQDTDRIVSTVDNSATHINDMDLGNTRFTLNIERHQILFISHIYVMDVIDVEKNWSVCLFLILTILVYLFFCAFV